MRRSLCYLTALYRLPQRSVTPSQGPATLKRRVIFTTGFHPTRAMSADRKVDLTYEDIMNLKAKKEIILVDVRDHNEIQETGKLPDSVHIPLGELSGALQSAPDAFMKQYGCTQFSKDAQLVFSCRSGMRSRKAMTAATELGFTNVRHYVGGFLDWQEKTK